MKKNKLKFYHKLKQWLNIFAYKCGIKNQRLRQIFNLQFTSACFFLIFGLVSLSFSTAIFWLSIGIFLGCYSFLSLTKIALSLMLKTYSAGIVLQLVLRSQLRLIGIAVIICLLHIFFQAQVWAMLLGLSVGLISIILSFANKIGR